jgi:hypothetical protein
MKHRTLIFLALGIVLFGLLTTVSCDKLNNVKASISGTVYMDGRPSDGSVVLKDANGATVQMVHTNTPGGHYIIKDVTAGNYTLVFLNMAGIPWGGGTPVKVRLGRFETVDLHLTQADRKPVSEFK